MRGQSLKILLLSVFLGICMGSVATAMVAATGNFTLQSVTKQDEVNVTKFTLQFSQLPKFQIRTSGQRLEVSLLDTVVAPFLAFPQTDERLVQIIAGQAKRKLVLSFLLRRPPYFVNGVQDKRDNRMVIAVHWRDDQKRMRPAITASLPGHLSVQHGGGSLMRVIASKYRGNWGKFFSDYECAVSVQGKMKYTVAPFPCLALVAADLDFIPLEAVNFAQHGDWRAALTALDHVGLETETGAAKIKWLLFRADIHARAGHGAAAQRDLNSALSLLTDGSDKLTACALLQQLYVAKDRPASPYELLAEMDLINSAQYPLALQRYYDLLQAEVAIGTGDIVFSKSELEDGLHRGVGNLSDLYQLRLADIAYLAGDFGGAIEQYRAVSDVLARHPFSVACYANSLYRTGKYDAAIKQLKVLLTMLIDPEPRDMARYLMALALMHRGDKGAGADLLQQINYGTEGANLARGKLADLNIVSDDLYRRQQALATYAQLSEELIDRDERAQMQFKHALALYLLGQRLGAIDELEAFLRTDHLSQLRGHAQALLVEILPEAIHRLVEDGKYFNALVLVEQNRDLLVASHRDFGFLVELGQVFKRLGDSDSAVRLYQYLLDMTKVGTRQESVFVPLMEALLQKKDYAQVNKYAQQYRHNYPHGKAFAAVVFLQLRALLADGKSTEVLALFKQGDLPQSQDINRLGANLAWQNHLLPLALKNIDAVVGEDLEKAAPADLMLQAEILYAQGEYSAALLRYRRLAAAEGFADQALYREASILLSQGSRVQGLKLLRQLVEKGKQSSWRKLAQEMLKIEHFKQ